jgi:hypothetical protein
MPEGISFPEQFIASFVSFPVQFVSFPVLVSLTQFALYFICP